MNILIVIIISYSIGSISSAFFIGKIFRNIDIRKYGSGNSGATNALRVMGLKFGGLTFLLDSLKGIVAVLLARMILGNRSGDLIAGFFVVVGHNWPIFIKFKGGKGVATSLGLLLLLNWQSFIIALGLGVSLAFITKYISLASLSFLISNPFIYIFLNRYKGREININFLIFIIILALLSVFRHKDNIIRLINGNENKIGG